MNRSKEEFAEFPKMNFLLLCVNKTYESEGPYNATRYSWKVNPEKAKRVNYVIAVSKGIIIGVFEAIEWLPANKDNFPDIPAKHGNWDNQEGRIGFNGHLASEERQEDYVGKRIPREWRFKGNPVRYIP